LRVKTEEKRQAIIDVAREVFRAKGYAAASMAEISARLGGSKGTLYSYFTSKEELFVAVMLEMARNLGEPIFEELERSTDPREAVRRFARGFVALMASEEILDFRRMVYAEGARSDLGKLVHEKGKKEFIERFSNYYAGQVQRGAFREADPQRACSHLEGLCTAGPVDRLLEGVIDHVSDEELAAAADAATDVFLRAYALETQEPV
jgi:AcrR family transcriptional regulator